MDNLYNSFGNLFKSQEEKHNFKQSESESEDNSEDNTMATVGQLEPYVERF